MKSKMKFICSLITLLLINISVTAFAIEGKWIEKKRTVIKAGRLERGTEVVVDNQYGDVNVHLWDKQEIKVEVVIKADAPSDKKAIEYIELVSIIEKKVDNQLQFITEINGNSGNWNALKQLSQNGKNYLRIDYEVNMPRHNALIVKNKFGKTNVPSFDAVLTIDSKYGEFKGGNLSNPHNSIKIMYGNCEIGSIEGGKVDVRYSNLEMDKAGVIELVNKYGKMKIGEVRELDANIDYSGASVNKITGTGKVKLNYSGKFQIDEINADLLDIQAAFSSIILPAEPANYNVTVTHGDFKYPSHVDFNMKKTSPVSPSRPPRPSEPKKFEGTVGNVNGSIPVIRVISKFGDVRLKD